MNTHQDKKYMNYCFVLMRKIIQYDEIYVKLPSTMKLMQQKFALQFNDF